MTQPREGRVGVDGDNKARRDGNKLNRSEIDSGEVDGDKVGDDKVGKKVQKMSKFKNMSKFKKIVELDFLILRARLAFTKLRQIFVKVPIFHHFDPKRHIQIKTDISGYIIGRVPSQLTSENFGQ